MSPMAKHHFTKEQVAQHLSSLLRTHVKYEYKFHPTVNWRFDFAIPCCKLAIEIEGAVWAKGRHTRGGGFIKDIDKYNNAAILGWRLLRFTPKQLETSTFLPQIEDYFGMNPCPHIF